MICYDSRCALLYTHQSTNFPDILSPEHVFDKIKLSIDNAAVRLFRAWLQNSFSDAMIGKSEEERKTKL